MFKMNEFTRPTAVLGYATGVGLAASTIFLNNKITVTNSKLTDLTEDVEAIRDGVKEKVPAIENTLKMMDHGMKNIASVVNNHAGSVKKTPKLEKRLAKACEIIEGLMEQVETLETRYQVLIDALKSKGSLDGVSLDTTARPVPVAAPKPVPKKKARRLVSSDEESGSESSDDEKQARKKKQARKNKNRNDSSDEDEVDFVARMARGGK
jgi:hypothetical protein